MNKHVCQITLPTGLTTQAIQLAANQRRRAYAKAVNEYGEDHLLSQTLLQEAIAFEEAKSTILDITPPEKK